MTDMTADQAAELLDAIRTLTRRVDALETRLEQFHPEWEVPEDVLLAISAACAAFLGHRAKVRQVHLRRHTTWAKQGRMEIQHAHYVAPSARAYR